MRLRLLLLLIPFIFSLAPPAAGYELQPLATRNLAPAALGFGLPRLDDARTLPAQSGRAQLTLDLVSNASLSATGSESLAFDGETYRLDLSVDYGIAPNWEVGISLPLVSHQGGFLDHFIEGWHDTFGLPQGGRDLMPANRLDYSYSRAGGHGFTMRSDSVALGDLSLRGAWQLWADADNRRAVALRAGLKLPTGRSDRLTGSGSADLALWLSGEQRLDSTSGQWFFYGGGGGIIASNGRILADQQRNLVGFLSFGCGWQPWDHLGFQLQFDGHTPLFSRSSLAELGDFAGQLAIGGSLALGEQTSLELAVTEDVLVATTPDVVFHLALKRRL